MGVTCATHGAFREGGCIKSDQINCNGDEVSSERLGRMWGTVLNPSKEMGSDAMDHMQQAQNRFHWLPAVQAALNFWFF